MRRRRHETAPRPLVPHDSAEARAVERPLVIGDQIEQRVGSLRRHVLDERDRLLRLFENDERRRMAHPVAGAFDDGEIEPTAPARLSERRQHVVGPDRAAARSHLDQHASRRSAQASRTRRHDQRIQCGLRGDRRRPAEALGADRRGRRDRTTGSLRRGRAKPPVHSLDVLAGDAPAIATIDLDQRRHRAFEETVRGFNRDVGSVIVLVQPRPSRSAPALPGCSEGWGVGGHFGAPM